MASLFVADNAGTGKQARGGVGIVSVTSKYTLTGALVVNDVIQMAKIPAGAVIQEVVLSCTDLDTASSPAIVLEVGDDGDTDRFIGASTVGQAGGVTRLSAHAGHGYQYSAANTIDVKVATGPTTGAATGTITLTAIYTMQDDV